MEKEEFPVVSIIWWKDVEKWKHHHFSSKYVDEQKLNWIEKLFDLVLGFGWKKNWLLDQLSGEWMWRSEDITTSEANLQMNKSWTEIACFEKEKC